ncbi:GAF domain-containing protein [Pseudonocardia kujensis]|uniref:sensor histidine kinase n=1 Tax=Pseudonocardia kujensis TaxID=1128675 RepID=UPI001E529530|nr:GAF domain-containing protein [Pseudonocardia kujensis]MCE0764441.1 GAF domain-containing protein [Pseudonocardia kujensis]
MSVDEPSAEGYAGARAPGRGRAGPADPALTSPDLPRLEFEQLMRQLVERAGEVMATQGRLRGLLRANQAVITDLTLPEVLRRVCGAARELVDARYAALGVLGPDGHIAELVQVGMDEETVRAIGTLPEGKGLLSAVLDEGRPIRLRAAAEDPRSSGLPSGHPPVRSFLGVPIRIRDEKFGGLYLAECGRGEFSPEDEELTRALAVTAGVAIDNARLYESTRRRGEWLAATAAVTRETLDPSGGRPLGTIAERSRELTGADLAVVLLPEDEASLRIVIAESAPGQEAVADHLRGAVLPRSNSLSGHVFDTRRPLRLSDPRELPDLEPAVAVAELRIGPVLVVPLLGAEQPEGVLLLARRADRQAFTEEDERTTAGFANQAAVALELAEARVERERLHVLDERERIAADLHDHVIQRLFAAGLSLQGVAARLPAPEAERLTRVIGDLDDTIAQIRTSIFSLQHTGDDESVRSRILVVVTESARLLGFTPLLRFSGPAETLVAAAHDASLAEDVTAVLREALVNVAKHAGASRVEVDVVADTSGGEDRLSLVVTDDGKGPVKGPRRSGLANLERRAGRRGGTFELNPHIPRGSRLRWTVPLG